MKHSLSALLIAVSLAALPLSRAAADSCSRVAEERLAQYSTDGKNPTGDVAEVQDCLNYHRCYALDYTKKLNLDGIVGDKTQKSLMRWANGECGAPAEEAPAPAPVVLEPPPAKEQVKKEEDPQCGDGHQWASWNLTAEDLKKFEADQLTLSDQLKAGLNAVQNIDYPAPGLLIQAVSFFSGNAVQYPPTDAVVKHPQLSAEKLQLVQNAIDQEIEPLRPAILKAACKAAAPNDTMPAWEPRWHEKMYDYFAEEVYGFWPARTIGSKGAPVKPQQVDFGLFRRVGWLAVSFTDDGGLELPANLDEVSKPQIDMARRFSASVDLVVHRRMEAKDWQRVIPAMVEKLPNNIAATVGKRRGGALDWLQYWLFPPPLTLATSAWDGVTLDLEGYPYDDPAAVGKLVDMIGRIRDAFNEQEHDHPRSSWFWHLFWWHPARELHVNLMVPYDALVTGDPSVGYKTLLELGSLVPKNYGSDNLADTLQDATIDSFIVFLPEFTSDSKKQLRSTIEKAFSRNDQTEEVLKGDRDLSLAVWRMQFVRNVVMTLSPSTWPLTPDFYTVPGRQFYDDMIYARNNFSGVGFWPVADYNAATENPQLSTPIHLIFRGDDENWFENVPSANYWLNDVSYYRRVIFLVIGTVFLCAVLYFLAVYWISDLSRFNEKYGLWIKYGAVFDVFLLFPFLMIFPGMRESTFWILIVVAGFAFIAFAISQWVRRNVEENLP